MPAEGNPGDDRSDRRGDSHARSIAKAVSWRLLGSLDTLVLSYVFTGSVVVAGTIASTETVTKSVLYYLHERAWSFLPQGRP